MTVDDILSLPVAQRLQLRTAGLVCSDVKVRPAGGSKYRNKALVAAGIA